METALGTRLIVCCLEVLPLRPFVYCRMRSLILGLSFGRSEKKRQKQKTKWRRSLELGSLVPQHNQWRIYWRGSGGPGPLLILGVKRRND